MIERIDNKRKICYNMVLPGFIRDCMQMRMNIEGGIRYETDSTLGIGYALRFV